MIVTPSNNIGDGVGTHDRTTMAPRVFIVGHQKSKLKIYGTSDRRFLMADERGSIVSITDSAGATIAINAYDEYGIPAPGNIGRFGYTGQAWVPELRMWYYKARMYSPTLGRFMQTDPIGYAGGDPVNGVDPSGAKGDKWQWECYGNCPTDAGYWNLGLGGGYYYCIGCGQYGVQTIDEDGLPTITVTAPQYIYVPFVESLETWHPPLPLPSEPPLNLDEVCFAGNNFCETNEMKRKRLIRQQKYYEEQADKAQRKLCAASVRQSMIDSLPWSAGVGVLGGAAGASAGEGFGPIGLGYGFLLSTWSAGAKSYLKARYVSNGIYVCH